MATVNVYINGGVPSLDPVTIQTNDHLVITNNDTSPHLIELWTKAQQSTKIGVFLAASPGTLTFLSDPNDPNATIYYNVLTPGQQPTNPTSGAHGIIVGSGFPMREKEPTAA
jgi:hypothetical protein